MKDILFGNNNAAIIKRLSSRYFETGKSRNVIAGVAIALTTLLFTAIFTLGSGLMDTVRDQNIRRQGGDGQAVLNNISDAVYEDVKDHPLIDEIAYTKAVSYRLQNPGMEKWPSELWYMDDTALEFARYTPTTGRRPQVENEIIADTIHTLTTSREPVLWRGAEWTPAAIERGELRGSVDGKAATVTLTACMDTLLTRYLASLPILPTRVNIYEHEPESGDTVQVFGGVVLEVIPGADATQVSVNCLSSSCILDAMLPRMIYSGQCQFVLFDSGCGLAAQSWGVTASVSVDGYLLASPSFAAYPNGYFTRGYAAAGGDFRFIVAHGGDTITLQLPFDSRVGNGGTVTAYPGCDGSPATCRDRFGNSARFGGCASIPSRNPAVWGFK